MVPSMGPNAEKALSHSGNFKRNVETGTIHVHLEYVYTYIHIYIFELCSLPSFRPPKKKQLQTKSQCFQASILLMVAQWFEKYLRIA